MFEEAMLQTEEKENEGFRVENDQQAEWCLRKIREAKAEKERWLEHYKAASKKAEEDAERTIAFFSGKLEEYFYQVPHKDTKTQSSYTLPGGKLVRKAQLPKFSTDYAELIPWLKDNFMFDYVKEETVESVNWAELKKTVTVTPDGLHVMNEDGEIIPGVTVEQRPDVFVVQTDEE